MQIQCAVRQRTAREELGRRLARWTAEKGKVATVIQAIARGWLGKREAARRRKALKDAEDAAAAAKMQALARARAAKEEARRRKLALEEERQARAAQSCVRIQSAYRTHLAVRTANALRGGILIERVHARRRHGAAPHTLPSHATGASSR